MGRKLILRKDRPSSLHSAAVRVFMPTKCSSFWHNEFFMDSAAEVISPSFCKDVLPPDSRIPIHCHILFEPELLGWKQHQRCSPYEYLFLDGSRSYSSSQSLPMTSMVRNTLLFSDLFSLGDARDQQYPQQQHCLELVEVHQSTSPLVHPSKEPLLLKWSAVEWNSFGDPLSVSDKPAKRNKARDVRCEIPVIKVYDKIIKPLNCDMPHSSPLACDPLFSSTNLEVCVFDDDLGELWDNSPSFREKLRKKKRLRKLSNRKKMLDHFEGRAVKERKKKIVRPLFVFYDVPLPKSRPTKSKNVSSPSVSDSGIVKRNNQFFRDHGLCPGVKPIIKASTLDYAFNLQILDDVNYQPEVSFLDAVYVPADLSIEDEARMALDIGRRLRLKPILDEDSALKGLEESISRRKKHWLTQNLSTFWFFGRSRF